MKKILLGIALLTAGSVSLFADNVVYLASSSTNIKDGPYYISPYTGADGVNSLSDHTGGAPITLFCDDESHGASFGQTWSANVTAVTSADSLSGTRFGASNPAHTGTNLYPAGTQLYEELAWLFTQSLYDSTNLTGTAQTTALTGIQEAAWHLTYAGTQQETAAGGSGYTSTGNTTTNSNTNTYSGWIADAAADYKTHVSGFQDLVMNDWYVVTPTNYTVSGSTQEFLAYTTATGTIPGTTGIDGRTPEPASFALFGGGLVVLGLFARRRKQSAL